MTKYIGPKRVKEFSETTERTPGDSPIIKVVYEDDTVEYFSKLMFDNIIADEKCDETKLRDKRVNPIVNVILTILREYGVKTGELPFFAALLNKSLDFNSNAALLKLLGEWMPIPNSLDDVDFITIDRILKGKK